MVPTEPPLVVIITREVSDLLSSSTFSPSSWEVIATDDLLLSLTKLPPTYIQIHETLQMCFIVQFPNDDNKFIDGREIITDKNISHSIVSNKL